MEAENDEYWFAFLWSVRVLHSLLKCSIIVANFFSLSPTWSFSICLILETFYTGCIGFFFFLFLGIWGDHDTSETRDKKSACGQKYVDAVALKWFRVHQSKHYIKRLAWTLNWSTCAACARCCPLSPLVHVHVRFIALLIPVCVEKSNGNPYNYGGHNVVLDPCKVNHGTTSLV